MVHECGCETREVNPLVVDIYYQCEEHRAEWFEWLEVGDW